jgi:hypothetical protein
LQVFSNAKDFLVACHGSQLAAGVVPLTTISTPPTPMPSRAMTILQQKL